LVKKYTFQYREFSPYTDYCEIQWNKKQKEWKFIKYYSHHQDNELPIKKHTYFLDLTIDPYNWGTLFSQMEKCFNEHMKELLSEEEIKELFENNYDRYVEQRDEFFKEKKKEIIDDWFEFTEEKIEPYIDKTIRRLKERVLLKKPILF
jgi:hypothetical protein